MYEDTIVLDVAITPATHIHTYHTEDDSMMAVCPEKERAFLRK